MMPHHLMASLRDVSILFPAFLAVFTFRGVARSFVAKLMGDDTSYQSGFLTLNPLAHVDIMGLSLILAVVFFLGSVFPGELHRSALIILLIFMGVKWTRTVPFDVRNFKNIKSGAVLTMLASSIGSIFLAFIVLYLQKYLPVGLIPIGAYKTFISIFNMVIDISVFFCVLDLLPIPPFDGAKVLQFLLPYSKQGIITWLEQNSFIIVFVLFFVPIVSDIFFFGVSLLGTLIKILLQMLVV